MTTEARRERVRALREQGLSYREIGRQLGISHEMARRDARDSGLTALTPVPDGLASRGQAFWDHATSAFELDRHEQELLTQVCRLLDRADALRVDIEQYGVVLVSSRGDRRPNPAVAEERQVSLAVGRLLGQLEIPAEDDSVLPTPAQARARKAARSRWDRRAGHGA
jgi:hypothetical protein